MNSKIRKITSLSYAMLFLASENSMYEVSKLKESVQSKDMKEFEENQMLSKGLKKFYRGEDYVWAINQKTADKKFKKKKL